MSELNDNEWSDLKENSVDLESANDGTGTEWDMVSQSSTNATHLTNPLNHVISEVESHTSEASDTLDSSHISHVSQASHGLHQASQAPSDLIPQISEDNELPILPNNDNNGNNTNNNIGSNSLIPSYIDIERELERQRAIVDNLRQSLQRVTNERNEAQNTNAVLEEKNNEQKNEIERLNDLTQRLQIQNNQLKRHKKELKNSKLKKKTKEIMLSKQNSKNGGKYHKNARRAKLHFRKQRTVTRKMVSSSRHW